MKNLRLGKEEISFDRVIFPYVEIPRTLAPILSSPSKTVKRPFSSVLNSLSFNLVPGLANASFHGTPSRPWACAINYFRIWNFHFFGEATLL